MWILRATNAIVTYFPKRNFSAVRNKLIELRTNDSTGVSILSMNNPPVNAFNSEFLVQMIDALDGLEKDKSKGLILTSSIPNVYAAGMDKIEFQQPNVERVTKISNQIMDMWLKLYTSSFPTVALINGHSPAGGCILTMACEYRIIVGEHFVIGLTEGKIGIPVPKWLILAMKELIGHRQTELAITAGTLFKPAEALKLGLIDEVVNSEDEGLVRANTFFERFKSIPAFARGTTKLCNREELINWIKEDGENYIKIIYNFMNNAEARKAIESYFPKQKSTK